MKRLTCLTIASSLVALSGWGAQTNTNTTQTATASTNVTPEYIMFVLPVDSRLRKAKPPAQSLARFLDYKKNGAEGKFVDNPDFWAKDIDFTCEAVWKTDAGPGNRGNMFGATAITPRHVIFSQHCAPAEGIELTFRGSDGTVVTRKLGPRRGVDGDIFVGVLDKDLPPTVRPATLLATDTARKFGAARGLPVITLNQNEEAVVADTLGLFWLEGTSFETLAVKSPVEPRATFYKPVVSGDSSNPRFFLAGDRAILICLMWHGNGGSGAYLPLLTPRIKKAVNELKSGYKVQEATFNFNQDGDKKKADKKKAGKKPADKKQPAKKR